VNRIDLRGLVACALLASCSSVGQYVWVEDYPQPSRLQASPGSVIQPGDLISVRVYNQEGMSAKGRVREDGKFSLPLLNDVEAAGLTPNALAQQLQTRLKEYVHLPVVTVSIEEVRPIQISVLGEVMKPGQYSIDPNTSGLLQAIAIASGLTDFAHRDQIFVLRQSPSIVRIRFRYDSLVKGEPHAAQFRLQGGDVLVVQ
jgi:polysaccharide export outer membrane protein